jgi:hypothetical protein
LLSAHNNAPPPTISPPTVAALECHRARRRTIGVPSASHRTSSLPSWSRNLLNPPISRSSSPHLGAVVASSPQTPPPSLPRPIISPHQHIAPDDAALSALLHAASAAIYLYRKRGPGKGEWTSSNCSMSNLFCCASDAFMRSWHLVAQLVVSSLFQFLPLVLSSENFRCYYRTFRL